MTPEPGGVRGGIRLIGTPKLTESTDILPNVTAVPFDVRLYTDSVQGTLRGDLHVDEYTGVDDRIAEVLGYLRRRQSDITGWLSVVLVTPTHKEARITAFLSSWAFERLWVTDALAAMAGTSAAANPDVRRSRLGALTDRMGPFTEAVVANVHGMALPAVHLAERLIDSWLFDTMLARLGEIAHDAVLSTDIARLRQVLERQERYFVEAANEWLSSSRRSQQLARTRLSARGWPMGADHEPRATTASVFATLFGSDHSWAEALDARVDALPGLRGLHLMRQSAGNPGRPVLRTSSRPAVALGRAFAALTSRRKGTSALR